MSNAPRGWNPPTAAEREAEELAVSQQEEWQRLHAAVFATGPGRTLLAAWHKRYVDEPEALAADERALLIGNTRRHFVRQIERHVEAALKERPKSI